MLVSAGQHLVALLSIANVQTSYLPLLLHMLPMVIHLISAGSWYLSKTINTVRQTKGNIQTRTQNGFSDCTLSFIFVPCETQHHLSKWKQKYTQTEMVEHQSS